MAAFSFRHDDRQPEKAIRLKTNIDHNRNSDRGYEDALREVAHKIRWSIFAVSEKGPSAAVIPANAGIQPSDAVVIRSGFPHSRE